MILTNPDNGEILVSFCPTSLDDQLLLNEAVSRITGLEVIKENNKNYIKIEEEVDIILSRDVIKLRTSNLAIIGTTIYADKEFVIVVINKIKNRKEDFSPSDFLWENKKFLNLRKIDIYV